MHPTVLIYTHIFKNIYVLLGKWLGNVPLPFLEKALPSNQLLILINYITAGFVRAHTRGCTQSCHIGRTLWQRLQRSCWQETQAGESASQQGAICEATIPAQHLVAKKKKKATKQIKKPQKTMGLPQQLSYLF